MELIIFVLTIFHKWNILSVKEQYINEKVQEKC